MFGFNLKQNFAFPYFSRDIAEFWRRWHISLTTWFRDYLYIPLGGSRTSLVKKIRNTIIIFVVSGFWHGPNWTFIAWGGLNAVLFIPLLLSNNNRKNMNNIENRSRLLFVKDLVKILFTFSLICFTWIFFRAGTLHQAIEMISKIFSMSIVDVPDFNNRGTAFKFVILVIVFILIEWFGRKSKYAIEKHFSTNSLLRYSFYYSIVVLIYFFGAAQQDFIYFQF